MMEILKDIAIEITPILIAIFQEYSANIYKNISTAKMYAVVEFEKIVLDFSSLSSLCGHTYKKSGMTYSMQQ